MARKRPLTQVSTLPREVPSLPVEEEDVPPFTRFSRPKEEDEEENSKHVEDEEDKQEDEEEEVSSLREEAGPKGMASSPYDRAASKAEAVRMICATLEEQGIEAGAIKPSHVYPLYATTKWTSGRKSSDEGIISNTLVSYRKKKGVSAPMGRSGDGLGYASVPTAPTAKDLVALSRMLATRGRDVEDVLSLLHDVEELEAEAGGREQLRECLTLLNELSGKSNGAE